MERVWKIYYRCNGFDMPIAVRGTEDEMLEYVASELGYQYAYRAMSDEEVVLWKANHMKVYCC